MENGWFSHITTLRIEAVGGCMVWTNTIPFYEVWEAEPNGFQCRQNKDYAHKYPKKERTKAQSSG